MMVLERILSIRKNKLKRLRKLKVSIDFQRQELAEKLNECNISIQLLMVAKREYCESLSSASTISLLEYQKKNILFDGKKQLLFDKKETMSNEIVNLLTHKTELKCNILNINKSIEKISYVIKGGSFG